MNKWLKIKREWRQRSRKQSLKHGHENTKYFHRAVTSRKRFSSIDSLNVDGSNTNDPTAIKSFHLNLYKETVDWRPELQQQVLQIRMCHWGLKVNSTKRWFDLHCYMRLRVGQSRTQVQKMKVQSGRNIRRDMFRDKAIRGNVWMPSVEDKISEMRLR